MQSGSLTLYMGCMYSGKTSELIREYGRWNSVSDLILCINHLIDSRYGTDDFMYSHNCEKVKCTRVKKLADLDEQEIAKYDVILINEGQFFEDLKEKCIRWCDHLKKNIIVAGLDGNIKRNGFGGH